MVDQPIPAKDIEIRTIPAKSGLRLSNFDTSHPEIGKPTILPKGITKSKLPNSASLRLYNSLTDGILEAQVENEIPLTKKQILKAIRCRCLASIIKTKKSKYQELL